MAVIMIVKYSHTEMGKALDSGALKFTEPEYLEGCAVPKLPYLIAGDEAFGLKPWLKRPYPGKNMTERQRIFNYRLYL